MADTVLATMRRGAMPKKPYLRRVEYLEYDGNQYIDTLIVPTQGYSFGASIFYIARGNPAKYGINGGSGSNARFAFGIGLGGYHGKYFGLAQVNSDTYSATDINEWIDWTIDSSSKIGTAGSERVEIQNANALDANGKSIYLMLSNPISSPDKHKGRCRNAWIKDQNGDYVFNAIPVLDLSGRPAMYDEVSGQFFYNQGAGEFTVGQEVPDQSATSLGVLMPQKDAEPTARDYVQDGLIAMWDGIENAGWGTHDANATVWKDLVGDTDIALVGAVVSDDHVFFEKNVGYGTAAFPSGYGAIELVLAKSVNTGNSSYDCNVVVIGSIYSGYGICTPRGKLTDTYDSAVSPCITIGDGELFAVTLNKDGVGTSSIAKNGVVASSGTVNKGGRYADGGNSINASKPSSRNSNLWIRSIRIYSRNLNTNEISHNYAIDKARFKLT